MNNINVLLAADENYADQLQITIKTTLENLNKKTRVNFIVLSNNLSNSTKLALKKLAHGLGMQLKLEFVPMPTKIKCEEYEKIETAGFFRSDTSIGGKR